MLGSEGNAGEQWKTTIGQISETATLQVQHTFFVHFIFKVSIIKECMYTLVCPSWKFQIYM